MKKTSWKENRTTVKAEMQLLIIAFFGLCTLATSQFHGDNRPLVHLQGNVKLTATGHHFNGQNHQNGSSIAHEIKVAHGSGGHGTNGGRGVHGGQPEVNGGDANGDGSSRSPNMQGVAGVIPLYAAGAGSNHHNYHRNGGNCNYRGKGNLVLAITIVAYLLGI